MQRARDGHTVREEHLRRGRRPLGIGNQHLVAGFEQRLTDDVQSVNAAVGDEHVFRIVDGNLILRAQLRRDELAQPRHAGGLQVMRLVLRDRLDHRRLDGIGRIEAHVALIETKWIRDRVHHVADADDAGERNAVEVRSHTYSVT